MSAFLPSRNSRRNGGLALTASARGRGDGDEREQRLRGFADAPVVLHRSAVGQHQIAAFRRVHAAPAAEADENVRFRRSRDFRAAPDVLGVGILADAVEDRHRDARRIERRTRALDVAGVHDPLVRDDQRAPSAEFRGERADPGKRAGPEDEPGARSPVEGCGRQAGSGAVVHENLVSSTRRAGRMFKAAARGEN